MLDTTAVSPCTKNWVFLILPEQVCISITPKSKCVGNIFFGTLIIVVSSYSLTSPFREIDEFIKILKSTINFFTNMEGSDEESGDSSDDFVPFI